jgi:hypothetical protein
MRSLAWRSSEWIDTGQEIYELAIDDGRSTHESSITKSSIDDR